MGLFDRFRETIFLKEDSDLEHQIEDLKNIPNYEKNKNILKEIKLLEIGLQGEKEIAFELKNANIGMYVLHDITIKFEDLVAHIDYIIITKGYTYLVECKNLIGNITVDNKGEFRREYEINGLKYKEAIYSPYTQAARHKEILKKRWLKNNNKLIIALRENAFDSLWYKPLVVLSNSKSLLNTKYAPKEIKSKTIRVDQLVRYIQEDLKRYDRDLYCSKKSMLEQANQFLEIHVDEYASIADKYRISNNNSLEEIKDTFKKYRKEKSNQMKVPAYYIFTDKELDKIIELKPDNLNSLKKLNI